MKFQTSSPIVLFCAIGLFQPSFALPAGPLDSQATEVNARNARDTFIDNPRSFDSTEALAQRDPLLWGVAAKVGWKVGTRIYGALKSRKQKRSLDLELDDDLFARVSGDVNEHVAKAQAANVSPWAFQLKDRRELVELEERDPLLWGVAAKVGWNVGKRVYRALKSRHRKRSYVGDDADDHLGPRSDFDFDLAERDFLDGFAEYLEQREFSTDEWEDVLERELEELD